MSKNNFTRSNVNESTLSISAPLRSSFDLSENACMTIPYGRLIPAHTQRFMPDSIIKGSMNVNMQLEKIATPTIGRLRMDTHQFLVYDNRVNKDIKQFISNDLTGADTLPSFKVWETYGNLLAAILGGNSETTFGDLWEDEQLPDYNTTWAATFFDKAIANYKALSEDDSDVHAYVRDFYAVEVERLTQLKSELIPATITANISGIMTRTILEILRPYVGAGSVIEQLGYPKLTMYSFEYTEKVEEEDAAIDDAGFATLFAALEVNQYFLDSFQSGPSYISEEVVSEMLIRKNYAVWFDYFRDFQIEKRENILDPDTWGKTPLLGSTTILDNFVQLLIAKYRYYGRDMLTTTQVDDIWRHVYAPIFGHDDASEIAAYTSEDSYNDMLNSITRIYFDSGLTPFPFPVGLNGFLTGTASDVLIHDLQVQRRAGMLEKYLMRKFFNPDTYSGVMEAHYGVKPEDYQLSCGQYLGGSEQMVNGEQNYANMETDATPRGTRTLVAGVATDEKNSNNFSYRIGGGFADLITYISLVPLVKYDACNPHLHEIHPTDMPLPEFAQDSRVEIRTQDLLRGFSYDQKTLGFVPRYMQYRSALDKVHGDYLEGKRLFDFVRDWFNITNESSQPIVGTRVEHSFELSPYSLRIHMRPDAFLGLSEWSNVAYGSVDLKLFVDCPLPAAVDFM